MNVETCNSNNFRRSFGKILFAVALTAIIVVSLGSLYVNSRERSWKRRWMKLAGELASVRQEISWHEIRGKYEGKEYEIVELKDLIKGYRSNVYGKTNNLIYEGSAGGFDFIIHYGSAVTHRMKVREDTALKISRVPLRITEATAILLRLNETGTELASDFSTGEK